MRSYKICLIAGVDSQNMGIGLNGQLIYQSLKDMKHFYKKTTKTKEKNKINAVMMGRKTFLSIGHKLEGRLNIVISKTLKNIDNLNVLFFTSIEKAEEYCDKANNIETLYIIGGQTLFEHYIKSESHDSMILTYLTSKKKRAADTFFPAFDSNKYKIKGHVKIVPDVCQLNGERDNISVKFVKYERIVNMEEMQYLNILKKILYTGEERETRNGWTKSIFAENITFDLSIGFPLLTTKKVWFKGVCLELLWFLKGNTNVDLLNKDKVRIWDGNTRREYLDEVGLKHYREGDAGPIYGFQWRHWNAKYNGCDSNYKDKGIDQLKNCIELINKNSKSRRIIFTGWNPEQLNEMSLPPCHVLYQFYVSRERTLSCQMYQRSADAFLGLPFNIASTALLTTILAHFCGLMPGKITICLGDIHIYNEHKQAVEKQLKNAPYKFPQIRINQEIPDKIEDYSFSSFEIHNYQHHGHIKAKMIT